MDLIFTQFPTISFCILYLTPLFYISSISSSLTNSTLSLESLSNQKKRVPRTLLLLFTSISSLLSFSNSVLPFQCPNQPNPFSSSLSFSFISSLFHFNKHMGNCLYNPSNKTIAEIVPHDQHLHKHHQQPDVRLYGSPSIFHTLYLRFALLHKGLNVRFIASESESDPIVIEVGSERVSGTRESLLQYIEARFPQTPLVMGPAGVESEDDRTLLGVKVTVLQHKSVVRHLERLVRWAEDLATRGGKRRGGAVDPTAGSPRMELRKFGKSYSQLRELMLEHAQMEEKVLFPILNSSDPGFIIISIIIIYVHKCLLYKWVYLFSVITFYLRRKGKVFCFIRSMYGYYVSFA